MLAFADGKHCHWTYRLGAYSSFLNWPSRHEVEAAVETLRGQTPAPEVFQVHAPTCTVGGEHE